MFGCLRLQMNVELMIYLLKFKKIVLEWSSFHSSKVGYNVITEQTPQYCTTNHERSFFDVYNNSSYPGPISVAAYNELSAGVHPRIWDTTDRPVSQEIPSRVQTPCRAPGPSITVGILEKTKSTLLLLYAYIFRPQGVTEFVLRSERYKVPIYSARVASYF